MRFKYKLLISVLLSFSFIFFVNAITITEFKELTDEQLQTWNYEFIGNTSQGMDTIYHFEMDVYRYYEPANTMRLEREPFYFACSEGNCSLFFDDQLEILQTTIFNEYKELQDELLP